MNERNQRFQIAGIDQLLPKDMSIHEELFDPCGYSMNAYRDDESDHYATIHVTPEKDFSFASFETNQDSMCLYKQTQKVLRCFRSFHPLFLRENKNLDLASC